VALSIPYLPDALNHASTLYEDGQEFAPSDALLPTPDVVIVGAGLTGLNTALQLARGGMKVQVCEAATLERAPSARSAGQLWPGLDSPFSSLVRLHGQDKAMGVWQVMEQALAALHANLDAAPDRCQFSAGLLIVARSAAQSRWLMRETTELQRAGFNWVRHFSTAEVDARYLDAESVREGMLIEGENPERGYGHINPRRYLQLLQRLCQQAGVSITTNCPVRAVQRQDGHYLAQTGAGVVQAGKLVVAGGVGLLNLPGVQERSAPRAFLPVQTVVLGTAPLSAELARAIVPGQACFCDAGEFGMIYGRLVPAADGSGRFHLLFGGAAGLNGVHTALSIVLLRHELYRWFPTLKSAGVPITHCWGGYVDATRTLVPEISEPLPGIYRVIGFSGQGIVSTHAYAQAVADRLLGRSAENYDFLSSLNPPLLPANTWLAWPRALADWMKLD
jgi:gamma-glutamylputrescine oxidase